MANNQVKGIAHVAGGLSRLFLIRVFLISHRLLLPFITFPISPHQMSLLLTVPIPAGCAPSWLLPLTAFIARFPPAVFSVSCFSHALCMALSTTARAVSLLSHSAHLLIHNSGSPEVVQFLQKGFKQGMSRFLVTKQRLSGWSLSDKSWVLCHSLFVTKLQAAVLNPTDSFPWSTSGTIEVLCFAQCDYKWNHSFKFTV